MTTTGSSFSSLTSSVFFGGKQHRLLDVKSSNFNRRHQGRTGMQITAMGKKARGKGKPPRLRQVRRQILLVVAGMLLREEEEEEEEALLQRNRTNR